MNERIREVWIKAANEDSDPDNWDTQEQFIERFAELIVRECAEICMKDIDIGWAMAPKSPWMAKQILEHFGVKE